MVDNSEQEDQVFHDSLENSTALFIDGWCDECGEYLVIHYHAVRIEKL